MTPYEEWQEKKPKVNYFEVFCRVTIAYVHIPFEKGREKFDEKR